MFEDALWIIFFGMIDTLKYTYILKKKSLTAAHLMVALTLHISHFTRLSEK